MGRPIKKLLIGCALAAMLAMVAWAKDDPLADFVPVTDAMLQKPADADWLMWRRTFDGWGYSPLKEITRDNVSKLQVAWSRALPEEGWMAVMPLVHDGVMYVPSANDVIQALDATTGDLLWEYRRKLPEGSGFPTTRSMAIWQDRLIHLTKDNYIIAIDARSGKLIWETRVRSLGTGTQTSGPLVVNGIAISGRNCITTPTTRGPEGCFITGHELESGQEVWRTYTIPKPGTPGDYTWAGIPWEKRQFVTTWLPPSYDPELDLVYFGTSTTSPYPKFFFTTPEHLDDEFLYQNSTLALDAKTGKIVWYQQHLRDQWDLDYAFERVVVDTVVAPDPREVRWINPKVKPGEKRRVLTGIPGKTGLFYTMDRKTGEFLWARETVFQNVIADLDRSTGQASVVKEQVPTAVGQKFTICPGSTGGKNWTAGAYSPLTNTFYAPLYNVCMASVISKENLVFGDRVLMPGEKNVGTVRGINVETGKELWRYENRAGITSLLATGGGLLFGGDVNRRFRAFDQRTGRVLWEHIMPAQVGGFPISYAVNGRQYVAVPVGAAFFHQLLLEPTPELRPGSDGKAIVVFALPAT